jgi:tRNA threonylcarbamoyladenosine biosynthesis protein TsaB
MRILGIDTTGTMCAVSLWADGKTSAVSKEVMIGHASVLVPFIEQALDQAKVSYEELDLVAVVTGPGSFTGLRVGIATARAIALAANKPLIGCTTFEAYAATLGPQHEPFAILIDSKRKDAYGQCFEADSSPRRKPFICNASSVPEDISLFFGDGAPVVGKENAKPIKDLTVGLIAYARNKFEKNLESGRTNCVPFYIREPEAKKNAWKSPKI